MSRLQPLSFIFSRSDPDFRTTVIQVSCDPYIEHAFIQTPLYDSITGDKIGYKVGDDYVQQVGPQEYIVRAFITYVLDGLGTITWFASYTNTEPSFLYPLNTPIVSTILSGTGTYYGSQGTVRLVAMEDGTRDVQITFV